MTQQPVPLDPVEAFSPSFLRALYIRTDADRDGRIGMDEV